MYSEIEYFLYENYCEMEELECSRYIIECLGRLDNMSVKELSLMNENYKSSMKRSLESLLKAIKKIISMIKKEYERATVLPKIQNLKDNRAKAISSKNNNKTYSMYNYPKGIKHIKDASVPHFNYNALKDDLETQFKFLRRYFGKYLKGDATFIENVRTTFRGSTDIEEISAKSINMQNIYSFCIEYKINLDKIYKNMRDIEKATESSIRKVESIKPLGGNAAYSVVESTILQEANSYGLYDESIDIQALTESIEDIETEIKRTKSYIDVCFKFLGIKMSILRESFSRLHAILLDNIATNS